MPNEELPPPLPPERKPKPKARPVDKPKAGRPESDDEPIRRKPRRVSDEHDDDRVQRPAKKSGYGLLLGILGGVALMFFVCCGGFSLFVYNLVEEAKEAEKARQDLAFDFDIPAPDNNELKTKPVDESKLSEITGWERPWAKNTDAQAGVTAYMPTPLTKYKITVTTKQKKTHDGEFWSSKEGPLTYTVEWLEMRTPDSYTREDYALHGTYPGTTFSTPPLEVAVNGMLMLKTTYKGPDNSNTEIHVFVEQGAKPRYFRIMTKIEAPKSSYKGFNQVKQVQQFMDSLRITKSLVPTPAPKTTEPKSRPPIVSKRPEPTPTPAPKMTTPSDIYLPPDILPPTTEVIPARILTFFDAPKAMLKPHSAIFEVSDTEWLVVGSTTEGGKQKSYVTFYDSANLSELRTVALGEIEGVVEAAYDPQIKRLYVLSTDSGGRLHDADRFTSTTQQVVAYKLDDSKSNSDVPLKPLAKSKLAGHVRTLGVLPASKSVFVTVMTPVKSNTQTPWKSKFLKLNADTLTQQSDIEFASAVLSATISPHEKTIAVVEHPLNQFGYESFGSRVPGIVRLVDAATWKVTRTMQTDSAFGQIVFLNDSLLLGSTQSGANSQLVKLNVDGTTTALEKARPPISTGFLSFDKTKNQFIASSRGGKPGVTLFTWKDGELAPTVVGTGLTSKGKLLQGPGTFLSKGKYLLLASGHLYEFND